MNPTAQASPTPPAATPSAAAMPPLSTPSLVENIPVHTPGLPVAPPDEDAELDKIMQDVGQELRKDDKPHKTHRFWEFTHTHKKEPNFSTQLSIKNAKNPTAVQAAPPAPAPAAPLQPPAPAAPASQTRVKPIAQKPAKPPKAAKPPKPAGLPLSVTLITILITAALIVAAYQAYK